MNNAGHSKDFPSASGIERLANILLSASSQYSPIDEAKSSFPPVINPLVEGSLPEMTKKTGTHTDGLQLEQFSFPVKYANEVLEAMPSPHDLRKRASETRQFVEKNIEQLINKLPDVRVPARGTDSGAFSRDQSGLHGHNSIDGNTGIIPAASALHVGMMPNQPQFYFLNGHENYGDNPMGSVSKNIPSPTIGSLDAEKIKNDFPILKEIINGKQLVWLDNAATTQKPLAVIERISYYYRHENSNVHRAAHELAARSTDAFEKARKTVQVFMNAATPTEIVFVRGTTEGINLVAKTWGEDHLHEGDEIILSHLEHHANIVPWQQLAVKKGLKIKVMPVDENGEIVLAEYEKLLSARTKIVSFTQVSNALGTITPAKQIIKMAHHVGAKTLVDGAQSVAHMQTDVRDLDTDWFVFSGHKIFGPTGIGVLYGKQELLDNMNPWQGGGGMIKDVTFEHTQFQSAPMRFEAGTGNIADAVGLGAAVDYISQIGMSTIARFEHELLVYATRHLETVPGLRMLGPKENKASVLSFTLAGFSTEQVSSALNKEAIAVRAGHHCAQPILRRFGLESTVRASLAFYNTYQDIDRLINALNRLKSRT